MPFEYNKNVTRYALPVTRTGGFTLIEIIVVLAVLGIIATIGLPVYRQIRPTLNLNSETRDIASDLRYAQQLAVAEQANYSILFDQVLNRYTITNLKTSQVLKTKNINSAITLNSVNGFTGDTVVFNVTGAATESGSIILINTNNATTTISIKPSGYVKIE